MTRAELDGTVASGIGNGLPPSQSELVVDLCDRLLVERERIEANWGSSGRRGQTLGPRRTS